MWESGECCSRRTSTLSALHNAAANICSSNNGVDGDDGFSYEGDFIYPIFRLDHHHHQQNPKLLSHEHKNYQQQQLNIINTTPAGGLYQLTNNNRKKLGLSSSTSGTSTLSTSSSSSTMASTTTLQSTTTSLLPQTSPPQSNIINSFQKKAKNKSKQVFKSKSNSIKINNSNNHEFKKKLTTLRSDPDFMETLTRNFRPRNNSENFDYYSVICDKQLSYGSPCKLGNMFPPTTNKDVDDHVDGSISSGDCKLVIGKPIDKHSIGFHIKSENKDGTNDNIDDGVCIRKSTTNNESITSSITSSAGSRIKSCFSYLANLKLDGGSTESDVSGSIGGEACNTVTKNTSQLDNSKSSRGRGGNGMKKLLEYNNKDSNKNYDNKICENDVGFENDLEKVVRKVTEI